MAQDPLDTPRDRGSDTEPMKVLRQVARWTGKIEALYQVEEERSKQRERESIERAEQIQRAVEDQGQAVVGMVEEIRAELASMREHCFGSTGGCDSGSLDQVPTVPLNSAPVPPAISIPPGTHPIVALVATRPILALGLMLSIGAVLLLLAWHGMRLSTFVPGLSSSEPRVEQSLSE